MKFEKNQTIYSFEGFYWSSATWTTRKVEFIWIKVEFNYPLVERVFSHMLVDVRNIMSWKFKGVKNSVLDLPGFRIPDMIIADCAFIPMYSLFPIECKAGPLQTSEEAMVHAPQLLRECIFCGSEYGVLTNSIDYWFFKFEIDPNKLPLGKTGNPESRYLYWHCPPVNSPITVKMMICLFYDIQAKKCRYSNRSLLKRVD
ncbi:unnamed protein product [Ambrosiozyma monospora]|uniref:Unnamed protein product n=1 Tax=Ambrosiozyma monospora TaxID=43982 RepID=A0ACB5STD2_AMBMO|nr:unnamed protein product [Ambrosiozyma monospora]